MFYYLLLLVATYYWFDLKVLYKSVLLSSKNVALRKNVTYHSQKHIVSVFYYVHFPLDMWNK